MVCRVDDVDDGVHASAVPLPHRPEARLASQIPEFHANFAFGDFAHVEADGRDHIFAKPTGLRGENGEMEIKLFTHSLIHSISNSFLSPMPYRNDIHQRRLSRIL